MATELEGTEKLYAAIRVRGSVNISPAIKKTMQILGLHRVNHLVLVRQSQFAMLKKAESYITFGEINEKSLALLLQKRGMQQGNKRLDEKFLKEKKFSSFAQMAKAVMEKKTGLRELGVKPVFRLKPPKKGFERKGIKKAYGVGGALGYRAADINELILRMI